MINCLSRDADLNWPRDNTTALSTCRHPHSDKHTLGPNYVYLFSLSSEEITEECYRIREGCVFQ